MGDIQHNTLRVGFHARREDDPLRKGPLLGHKLPRRGASKGLLRRSFSLLQIAPTSNDRQKRAKTFHMQQASASSPADLSSEWRTSERSMPPGEHAASRFNFKVIGPTPELCDGRDHYRAFRQVTIMRSEERR